MADFMREELSLKTLTEILKFESFPNIYLYGSTLELCEDIYSSKGMKWGICL